MATQLGLLFVIALLTSSVIAAVWLQNVGALIHPLSRSHVLSVLATAVETTRRMPPEAAAAFLADVSDAATRLWVADTADVPAFEMRPEERAAARDLQARAGLRDGTPIFMQLERVTGDHARAFFLSPAGWAPLRLRTSIQLPSGDWLNAIQHPSGGYEWQRILAYSLPVSTLPVLLVVLFSIYRVVRPIKRLAQHAERFSRGEAVPPLAVAGPLEARELTASFNTMQQRIARHMHTRTRMLAAISHDLNTPITALRLQVELMTPSDARDDMLESLNELRYMVNETLAFVRGDAVVEATSMVSLNAMVDDLLRRYTLMGKPVRWAHAEPVQCLCRPVALKRALTNLIDNALHYGGDASVSLMLEASQAIVLEVLDHGPGIAPEMLEQVFEPFVQGRGQNDRAQRHAGLGSGAPRGVEPDDDAPAGIAPSGVAPIAVAPHGVAASGVAPITGAPSSVAPGGLEPSAVAPHDTPGLGLGLAIARSNIHAHGGELTLENRPPAGLCAVIRLPPGGIRT
ncbi:ATP-binding protein [Alcaligenaceae bacterium C4P045]|nr:ATP-binding protein [Alcaligenaceae bacterium C4P045]